MVQNKYDVQLLNIEHYKKHNQMMPFIGQNYGQKKKLLVIGESHFCPKETDKNIIKNWYNIDNTNFNKEIIEWTATSKIIDFDIANNRFSGSHTIYRNIFYAINETGFILEENKNVLTYISYMNFFQKPAQETGESIEVTEEDKNVANDILKKVIDIIKPDYLFFVSSESWKSFNKEIFDINKVGHSSHPTSIWWNRCSTKYTKPTEEKTITGKESFKYFIKHNKIFD